MAKIGIVYGTNSKIIRRIIVPDDDNELIDLVAGESILMVDKPKVPHDLVFCADQIEKHTGTRPPSSRCAVVHKGIVVSVIHADPDVDKHHLPGHALYLHEHALPGWKMTDYTLAGKRAFRKKSRKP